MRFSSTAALCPASPIRNRSSSASRTESSPSTSARPLVGCEQGREDADGGGLSRAVGAEQAEHGAGLDLEVDALQGFHVAEVLNEGFCADDHIAHERVMVAGRADSVPRDRSARCGHCGTLPSLRSRRRVSVALDVRRDAVRGVAIVGALSLLAACSSGDPDPASLLVVGIVADRIRDAFWHGDASDYRFGGGRGEPIGITEGFGSVWVVSSEFLSGGEPAVYRIDPATNAVTATIPVGEVPLETTAGFGSIWVSNSESDSVSRIDPRANAVIATIDVCDAPEGFRDRRRIGLGRVREQRPCRDHRSRERPDVGNRPRGRTAALRDVRVR